MGRRKLVWQLFPTYLLVTLLSLAAATLYTSKSARTFYLEELKADLEFRARLLSPQLALHLSEEEVVDQLCEELGKSISTRITVILPDGRVIGDSEEDPKVMDNHGHRPEILTAYGGGVGSSLRYSHTLRTSMMYVALPLQEHGEAKPTVVRVSLPLSAVDETVRMIYRKILLGGLIIAMLAALVSWLVSRHITRPLEDMRQGADRFARGDLDQRLAVSHSQEIAGLAYAMNEMAAQLDDRIRTVVRQRNEQEAVLSSMAESVLAVDRNERLLSFNQAAADLLDLDPDQVQGEPIQAAVRNADLQRFVAKALKSASPVEDEFIFRTAQQDQVLQAHGTVLRDAAGKAIGAVIVLNDITRLRRLEEIKREFVANVSHELRTPITSIKGFVETLLDGGLKKPDDAQRFMRIIGAQADRLNAIIEDLLMLSRLEQDKRRDEGILRVGPLRGVLEAVQQLCGPVAEAKDISLVIELEEEFEFPMNSTLLEQGVINLVDNAVKYSEHGSRVLLEGVREHDEIVINVHDTGCGISEEHLPRLFERFYRIDRARSRRLGGTGLGLAIVKHIAQTHGGRVTVKSEVGKGSVFSIHLPAPEPKDETTG